MHKKKVLGKLSGVGLDTIFDLIPGGVVVAIDPNCKEVVYNPVAARFLRTKPWTCCSAADKQVLPFKLLRKDKLLAPHELPLKRAALLGEEVSGDELEIVWEDGVRKHALCSSRPLRDSQGRIISAVCTFEDITAEKQRVAEQEEQFKECLDNLLDPLAICEAVRDQTGGITDFKIKYVNRAGCREINATSELLVGRNLLETYPNTAMVAFADMCRVVETGLPHRNGDRLYGDKANPHPAGTYDIGQVKLGDGVALYWQNITERKRLEEELKKREEQYRTVVENQSDLVCRSLRDTTLTFVNSAYCKAYGKPGDDFIGKRWLEFIPSEERPTVERLWNEFCTDPSGANAKGLALLISADGERCWYEWVSRPILNDEGTVVEYQSVGRDRTAEVRLEEALKNSEKMHRVLLDNIPCLVFRLDKVGIIGFVNEYAREFFAGQRESLLGLPILETLIPADSTGGESLWRLAGDSRTKSEVVCEYPFAHDSRWVKWMFRRYINPVSGLPGILAVGVDISDRRLAEQALARGYELRYRAYLFNKALRGEIDSEELADTAGRAGIALAGKMLLYVIQIDGVVDGRQGIPADEQGKKYQAKVDRLVDKLDASVAVAWQASAGIAALMPQSGSAGDGENEGAEMLLRLTREEFPDRPARVGVAAAAADPPALASTYRQALFALRAGRSFGRGNPVHRWRDLGMLQLLSASWDSKTSRAFVAGQLGTLLAHDRQRASSLVDTLEAILTTDSVAAIANHLYIHEKTVLFRKRKIEKILGEAIDDHDKRTNLLTAIKLLRLLQADADR